jgi:hypothetical protein
MRMNWKLRWRLTRLWGKKIMAKICLWREIKMMIVTAATKKMICLWQKLLEGVS